MERISEKFELKQDLYQHFLDQFRHVVLERLLQAIHTKSLDYTPHYWKNDVIPNKLRENYALAENALNYDQAFNATMKLIEILNLGKARSNVEHSLNIEKEGKMFFMVYKQKPY